jgi:hypothetical protein
MKIYETRWQNKICYKTRPTSHLVWYKNVFPEVRNIQWTQKVGYVTVLNTERNKAIFWNTVSDNGKYNILVTDRSPSQIFAELLREK